MSLFDQLLGSVSENLDVASIAAKVGIDPATVQSAVSALANAHAQPGDTVATAAASSGIDSSTLSQIVSHIGGEGGLGQLSQLVQGHPEAAGLLNMFGTNGETGAAGSVLGMAKGLFS
jgi:hypothetical protein